MTNLHADPFLLIKLNYVQMNPAMKRIADVLLSRRTESSRLTIGELATRSGVSNATVTRFVQMLGFESYKVFSSSLQQFLQEKQTHPGLASPSSHAMLYAGGFPNKQDPESVCRYVIGSEIEMLNDTLSLMDFSLMERVAELIDRARQVIFLGEGRSHLAAESACSRFSRIGVLCSSPTGFHNTIPAVCMAKPGDLVIGISNMGHSPAVADGLAMAREQGVPTVAITSVKGSPIDLAADYTILTGFNYCSFSKPSQATCYEPGSENLPQYSVIDCLYLMCVMRKDQDCLDRYYRSATLINEKRS